MNLRLFSICLALCGMVPTFDAASSNALGQLRSEVLALTTNGADGQYSVYVEDLSHDASFGIDADRRFYAWSLLKVPVMMTVLKKVERGEIDPERPVVIEERHLKLPSTLPWDVQPGDAVPLDEVLVRLVAYSDNAASFVAGEMIRPREFQATLFGTGLPMTAPGKPMNQLPAISPRDFGAMLRSLHASSFLRRPGSENALNILSRCMYDSQLPAGVPKGTGVAHMVGYDANTGMFHDCGILDPGGAAVILCVMSSDNTRDEADRVISAIAREVFRYASSLQATRD